MIEYGKESKHFSACERMSGEELPTDQVQRRLVAGLKRAFTLPAKPLKRRTKSPALAPAKPSGSNLS